MWVSLVTSTYHHDIVYSTFSCYCLALNDRLGVPVAVLRFFFLNGPSCSIHYNDRCLLFCLQFSRALDSFVPFCYINVERCEIGVNKSKTNWCHLTFLLHLVNDFIASCFYFRAWFAVFLERI